MVFHTFSAFFSVVAGSFIFRHLALFRNSFLVLHPPFTRLYSRSQRQLQNVGFQLLDAHHSFTTPWPVHTPIQTRTENLIDHPLALGSQRHTHHMVNVSIPSPTSHLLLQRPPSSRNPLSIPSEPTKNGISQLPLPPTASVIPSSALHVLVHRKDSGFGSMSKSINSSMMSFHHALQLQGIRTEDCSGTWTKGRSTRLSKCVVATQDRRLSSCDSAACKWISRAALREVAASVSVTGVATRCISCIDACGTCTSRFRDQCFSPLFPSLLKRLFSFLPSVLFATLASCISFGAMSFGEMHADRKCAAWAPVFICSFAVQLQTFMHDDTPVCNVSCRHYEAATVTRVHNLFQLMGSGVSSPFLLRLSSASAFRVHGTPTCWSHLQWCLRRSPRQFPWTDPEAISQFLASSRWCSSDEQRTITYFRLKVSWFGVLGITFRCNHASRFDSVFVTQNELICTALEVNCSVALFVTSSRCDSPSWSRTTWNEPTTLFVTLPLLSPVFQVKMERRAWSFSLSFACSGQIPPNGFISFICVFLGCRWFSVSRSHHSGTVQRVSRVGSSHVFLAEWRDQSASTHSPCSDTCPFVFDPKIAAKTCRWEKCHFWICSTFRLAQPTRKKSILFQDFGAPLCSRFVFLLVHCPGSSWSYRKDPARQSVVTRFQRKNFVLCETSIQTC